MSNVTPPDDRALPWGGRRVMASQENCGWCRFATTRARGQLECQRYPPVPHPMGGSRFPETEKYLWCGEWRRDEKKAQADAKKAPRDLVPQGKLGV